MPYRKANLVALWWHLPVVALLYIYSLMPDRSCDDSTTALNCFSGGEGALLLAVAFVALLLVSWLLSMAITALLLRLGQSAQLAGGVAAISSMVLLWIVFRLTIAVVAG